MVPPLSQRVFLYFGYYRVFNINKILFSLMKRATQGIHTNTRMGSLIVFGWCILMVKFYLPQQHFNPHNIVFIFGWHVWKTYVEFCVSSRFFFSSFLLRF
jgi:hypothetical protein